MKLKNELSKKKKKKNGRRIKRQPYPYGPYIRRIFLYDKGVLPHVVRQCSRVGFSTTILIRRTCVSPT